MGPECLQLTQATCKVTEPGGHTLLLVTLETGVFGSYLGDASIVCTHLLADAGTVHTMGAQTPQDIWAVWSWGRAKEITEHRVQVPVSLFSFL